MEARGGGLRETGIAQGAGRGMRGCGVEKDVGMGAGCRTAGKDAEFCMENSLGVQEMCHMMGRGCKAQGWRDVA